MLKFVNFIVPFLIEMLFGKKDDKVVLGRGEKLKRRFVYAVMVMAFALIYFLAGKVYNLSVNYVDLKKQKVALEERMDEYEAYKAKAEQLEKSLQLCMMIAYSGPSNPRKAPEKPK